MNKKRAETVLSQLLLQQSDTLSASERFFRLGFCFLEMRRLLGYLRVGVLFFAAQSRRWRERANHRPIVECVPAMSLLSRAFE